PLALVITDSLHVSSARRRRDSLPTPGLQPLRVADRTLQSTVQSYTPSLKAPLRLNTSSRAGSTLDIVGAGAQALSFFASSRGGRLLTTSSIRPKALASSGDRNLSRSSAASMTSTGCP